MIGWLKNLVRTERPSAGTQRPARIIRARYDAAVTTEDNRRHWINADALSPDAANNVLVRRNLRIRSRYEVANNSYARGIVNTLANDVIGTGPRLQMLTPNAPANKRIEQTFRQWTTAVDLTGKLSTMRCARTQDGESFGILVTNPKLPTPVKLDLRLVEADQVTTPILLTPSLRFVDGIVLDVYNNPVEYHVLREHPGSQFVVVNPWDFDRIPASQVIHLFRADRPGQHRGIPEIMASLPLFAQLRRFTLAVIAAAETAADFAGILYTDAPANGEADAAEPFEPIELEKRALLTMPGGWKMSQLQAEQPATTYAEFKKEILNEIARCLNMPFNVAAGNSASYNYASGRLDHQVYYKAIRVDQTYLERTALNRIFFAWLDEAVLIPGLIPPGMGPFSDWAFQWFWDGTEHVDPLKEATAQQTRLANHTTTLAHEYAREGRDWAEALRQRAKEIALMEELGLPVPVPTTMQPPVPAPAPAHDPGEVEPEEVGSDEDN
jgi:lambda family phage portal protein